MHLSRKSNGKGSGFEANREQSLQRLCPAIIGRISSQRTHFLSVYPFGRVIYHLTTSEVKARAEGEAFPCRQAHDFLPIRPAIGLSRAYHFIEGFSYVSNTLVNAVQGETFIRA
jgi:hypothetical protein